MGWIEQSIRAFQFEVKKQIHKGESLSSIIMREHMKSNIPATVLIDWYGGNGEIPGAKNAPGETDKNGGNGEIPGAKNAPGETRKRCEICGNLTSKGKWKTKDGTIKIYYRKVCEKCRRKKLHINKEIKT